MPEVGAGPASVADGCCAELVGGDWVGAGRVSRLWVGVPPGAADDVFSLAGVDPDGRGVAVGLG